MIAHFVILALFWLILALVGLWIKYVNDALAEIVDILKTTQQVLTALVERSDR